MSVTYTAGQTLKAGQLNKMPRGVIAWFPRPTQKSGFSAETAVLRIDDVPIFAGRKYEIKTQDELIVDSTTATDVIGVRLRYTTDGSTPGTASTLLAQTVLNVQRSAPCGEFYRPAVDEMLSVVLTAARLSGTGTLTVPASNPIIGGFQQLKLEVIDHGLVDAASGTSL
jgi:hypothetical protein